MWPKRRKGRPCRSVGSVGADATAHSARQAPTWIDRTGEGESGASLLVILGRNDLAAPVKTVRADVMAQMRLAGGGLRCQRRGSQKIVRAVVPAAGDRLLVLLDSHWNTREEVKRAILRYLAFFEGRQHGKRSPDLLSFVPDRLNRRLAPGMPG